MLVDHPASTYFVRVDGNGMTSENAYTGDILVVDRGLTPSNGDMVVAVVNGEMVVRLLRDSDSGQALVSDSGDSVTPINEEAGIEFWGVVTAAIHQFRKKA